jgi:hypothetical protein
MEHDRVRQWQSRDQGHRPVDESRQRGPGQRLGDRRRLQRAAVPVAISWPVADTLASAKPEPDADAEPEPEPHAQPYPISDTQPIAFAFPKSVALVHAEPDADPHPDTDAR